jgi:hypothetical protein
MRDAVINFRIVAAIALIVFLGAPAQAQTIYRKDVPPGDATPTGASFSVRFPVPYSDVEMKAEDPPNPAAIVRMVTGLGPDQIRFSATEMPFMTGATPNPMEDFVAGTKSRRDAEVTDMRRGQDDNLQTLSFTLTDFSGGSYFRMIRDNRAQYMLVVQFPLAQRDQAIAKKDDFFGSFKIIKP